jgi:FkbM family methyltransferase
MLSYAQNAEDVVLWRALSAVDPDEGFYIDVGANHPVIDSVTKHFYETGWQGVNVEPLPHLAEEVRVDRPRDVNLRSAVGLEPGNLQFHHVVDNAGLSTFNEALAAEYRSQHMTVDTIEVPVTTLAAIFDEHADERAVHFLKIDVEGYEHEVIQGADWKRHRPWVVVIEATTPDRWEDQMRAADYVRVLDDGINFFFVAREHPELAEPLSRPATVVDRFTTFEVARRIAPFQEALAHYAAGPLADALLEGASSRARKRLRPTAGRLVDLVVRREDLLRTFAGNGRLNRVRLTSWALDVDPAVDPDIAALQDARPQLEQLRGLG